MRPRRHSDDLPSTGVTRDVTTTTILIQVLALAVQEVVTSEVLVLLMHLLLACATMNEAPRQLHLNTSVVRLLLIKPAISVTTATVMAVTDRFEDRRLDLAGPRLTGSVHVLENTVLLHCTMGQRVATREDLRANRVEDPKQRTSSRLHRRLLRLFPRLLVRRARRRAREPARPGLPREALLPQARTARPLRPLVLVLVLLLLLLVSEGRPCAPASTLLAHPA